MLFDASTKGARFTIMALFPDVLSLYSYLTSLNYN
jgi:hypothetical protein